MPSLVEIGPVVLKKKTLKVLHCIFAISLLSLFGKGRGPSFEQTWILLIQGCFVPSLVETGPMVLEKMKMWKSDGRTTGDQKIFQLRWAKNAFLANWIGQSHIFVMNRCKLRLSDETHSKTKKKFSNYFLLKIKLSIS